MANYRKSLIVGMMSSCYLLLAAGPADAQFLREFFDSGSDHDDHHNNDHDDDHHHHDSKGHRVDDEGHHIDNHGHHTGSRGVYDNGTYYQPSRNYVQPRTNSYRPYSNPLPRVNYSGELIRIVNPRATGAPLHYDLNAHHYDIEPGQAQSLNYDKEWIIVFDRGEDFGTGRYVLTPGIYEFKVTSRGWELYKKPLQAVAVEPPAPPAPEFVE